ncbi:hypothetical protein BLX88_25145, partial [Bacillus obstructivus]
PPEEGGGRGARGPAGGAGEHRLAHLHEHPRARGRADPRDRVRLAQPADRGHRAGRACAQGPDQGRDGARDHPGADPARHGGVLQSDPRGADQQVPHPHAGDGAADRHVPAARADRDVPA